MEFWQCWVWMESVWKCRGEGVCRRGRKKRREEEAQKGADQEEDEKVKARKREAVVDERKNEGKGVILCRKGRDVEEKI